MNKDKIKSLKRENQSIREMVNWYDKLEYDDKRMMNIVPDDAHYKKRHSTALWEPPIMGFEG